MTKMEAAKDLEKVLKALASRRRLAIVRYVKEKKEAPVGDIAQEIHLSFKSTSRHLAILTAADILEKEQRGLRVFYGLPKDLKFIVKQVVRIL